MEGFEPPGYCPNCGEYVEEGARACPGCGSCAETGWSGDDVYDGLDLPVGYGNDEAAEKERPSAGSGMWPKLVAGVLLGLLVLWLLGRF